MQYLKGRLTTDKIQDYISWMLLVATIMLLRFTGNFLENVVAGKKFALGYLFVGLLLASVITYCLYQWRPGYYKSSNETRGSAVAGLFFAIIFLTLFAATYINYETGKKKQYVKKVVLLEKSKNAMYGTLYAFLLINNKRERFAPSREEWNQMKESDSVEISLGKGTLKYEYIYRFKSVK